MHAFFAIIAFFATLIGAVFGIGGGVIIKPAMEAVSGLHLAHINALSGVTVLCMAAVSLTRYLKYGDKLSTQLFCLSLGAAAGGFLGKYLFDLMKLVMTEAHAKVLQYAMLILLLSAALLKGKFRSFHIQNKSALFFVGLFMGTLSAFLGIGGGPINLLVIHIVFGLDAKQAAVYSVVVILCSQLATTALTSATGGYAGLDMLHPLAVMVPAAIAGGLIGPKLHVKWELMRFERYYSYLLWALIILNVYNIAHILRVV